MIAGLRTAIYTCADLAQGKAWYARVLDAQPYFDEPFYVGFAVGGFELGLVPDGARGRGGVTVYWGVADCAAAVKRLVQLGAAVEEDAHDVGGGIKAATVIDPFGNAFGVIENPHFDPAKVR
jgi:predicted enzyme related to lactoylglutathione lyase